MNNKLHFDKWAGDYDESILRSIDKYPFEKYYDVLSTVINKAELEKKDVILDIGIGTGTLSLPLYEKGYKIIGLDFSKKMLERAKEKMPSIITMEFNMKESVPNEIKKLKPTKAISTYAIHHLNFDEKVRFIKEILFDILEDNGLFVIGDVSFVNKREFENCRTENERYWDDDEDYLIANDLIEELKKYYIHCEFSKIGSCAGVLVCKKKTAL